MYALAGYNGVLVALIAMGALAVAIAWRWTLATLNAPGATTFAWAAIALTAPYLLNTFTVYPEIAAAPRGDRSRLSSRNRATPTRRGLGPWIASGLAIASLPWLSTKYAPMSAALLLIVIYRLGKREPASLLRNPKARAVVAIYAISLAWVVRVFLRHLGEGATHGAVWLDDANLAAQPARGRARIAVRSGIRVAGTGAGLHPRRHGPVAHVESWRSFAAPGD